MLNIDAGIARILKTFSEGFARRLKSGLQQDGTDASGDTVRSVRSYVKGDAGYIEYRGVAGIVNDGIGGGKAFPTLNNIMDWMTQKGIVPMGGRSKRDSAFLISRAIKAKGTIKRRGYGGTNILNRLIADTKLNARLQSDLGALFNDEISVIMTRKIKI